MKIALIGKGKTGGKVLEIARGNEVTVFDRSNNVTEEKLRGHDVIIAFVSGPVFKELIPILIKSQIPVVTGSTGLDWPEDIVDKLVHQKTSWIRGTNFSLGMRLVHEMILTLSKANSLFEDFNFDLHEVHHTKKLDAPSGTALSWKEWLNENVEITSERTGDVVGDHQITLTTPNEKIYLRHEALDRKIFAQGALWAAKKLIEENFKPGLYDFEEIACNTIKNL